MTKNNDALRERFREVERVQNATNRMLEESRLRPSVLEDVYFRDDFQPLGAQILDAIRETRSEHEQSHEPERRDEDGFIINPVDEAAYVPLMDVLNEHTPGHIAVDYRGMKYYLDTHKQVVRQWRPRQNRRSVHLGDWIRLVSLNSNGKDDGWADDPAGVASRKKIVRDRRAVGG